MLEQRQRAGLVDHVGDDVCDQTLLELEADPLGRCGDRLLELARRQRQHRDLAGLDQLGEIADPQRPVEEISP